MAASCTDCSSSSWAAGSSPSLPLLSVYSSMFPFWFFAGYTSLSTHLDTHSTSTASDKLVWTRYRVNSHMWSSLSCFWESLWRANLNWIYNTLNRVTLEEAEMWRGKDKCLMKLNNEWLLSAGVSGNNKWSLSSQRLWTLTWAAASWCYNERGQNIPQNGMIQSMVWLLKVWLFGVKNVLII